MCMYIYYLHFTTAFKEYEYSQFIQKRMDYYQKYKEPALGLFGKSFSNYFSIEKLNKLNLIKDGKVLFTAYNPEEQIKYQTEYGLNPQYKILSR